MCQKNSKLIKLIPKITDHMSNIRKLYAPSLSPANKLDKLKHGQYSPKHIERYKEYYSINKNNGSRDNSINIIPNRKLNPLKHMVI
jgi:hypothetical protein